MTRHYDPDTQRRGADPHRLAPLPDGHCLLHEDGALRTKGWNTELGRTAQRRRRARILATVRQFVGSHGRDGFAMKEVAEICEVSVQTIHNLIGDRPRVLVAAANEFIAASFSTSGDPLHPMRFLVFADNYWATAVQHPGYVRNATIDYFAARPEFRHGVQSFTTRMITDSLMAMKQSGALDRNVDIQGLAYRFTCMTAAIVFDWAIGGRSLGNLRSDLSECHAAILRDVVSGGAVEEIERWLEGRHTSAAPALTAA